MIEKKKLIFYRFIAVMLMLISIFSIAFSGKVNAMTTGQEQSFSLLDSIVGRYNLNYIGNTNAFSKQSDGISITYHDVPGWGNSSSATLSQTPGSSKIVGAYLIWEVFDGASNPTDAIAFIAPNGRGQWLEPEYVVNDWRAAPDGTWAYTSMYCMATNVTDIVQQSGYGTYSVCNIPYYESGTGATGGESSASWQLVVVEEGDNFPVRVVSLTMGANFKMGTVGGSSPSSTGGGNYTTGVSLSNGVKSKSYGNATGQIIFGASNADATGNMPMTSYMTTYSGGNAQRTASANTTYRAGLYRNGAVMNDRDYLNSGCIRVDLSDISDIGNNADSLKLEVQQDSWTTFFMLGYSMDIAFPDFYAKQTTTVNSSTSVTVKGDIRNVSPQANTGIYDGELIVNIDPALTVTSATAVVDGRNITGVVSGNEVRFSGEAIRNIMQGSTITYTVECSTNNSGKTRFDNSDVFGGKLRADGIDTGYPINNACTSSSYGIPKYSITLNKGTGIKEVTGAGEYTYGTNVSIGAELMPGYHWKGWTGSYSTAQEDFSFTMPATNLTMTAEGEANQYMIHFEPNGGSEVIPIPDMTVRYDEKVTLPDATDAYIKYTLDGVNVTQSVLDGTIVLDENGIVIMSLDNETGLMVTPDGATVNEDGIKTKVDEDGTTTVIYPDGNVEKFDADGLATAPTQTETGSGADAGDGETGADTAGTADGGPGEEQIETTESPTESDNDNTASVERNVVSRVATAADGTDVDAADIPSAQAQSAAESDADPQPDKKAYASVFMGWSLEEAKDNFVPQWKAGEPMDVSVFVDAAGVTEQDGAVITLYAIWDDCPWIQATNLYYTLAQAQSSYITVDEILSHATASDREDGSPIAPGVHDDGTSFTIPDYAPTDFTQFQHEGNCTENLTVVDSVGNIYKKQITVYIVDTTAVAVKPEGTTRFIDEKYYNTSCEHGGLEENSVWKTDPEYVTVIGQAFSNLRNDTPQESYHFSHETILKMKEYIETHGFGNSKEPDALQGFYEQFLLPNKAQ